MVNLSGSSMFGVVLAFALGEDPIVYYVLMTPQSTPRDVVAYALVAATGVVYLPVQSVNAFDPTGVGVIVCLGASQAGILVVNAAGRSSRTCRTRLRVRLSRGRERKRLLRTGVPGCAPIKPRLRVEAALPAEIGFLGWDSRHSTLSAAKNS